LTTSSQRSTRSFHSFGWYLRKFIADAKARGATPIVCSLIPRKNWRDGKIVRNSEDYGKWAAEVAKSENVVFVDLNEIIARRYDELGEAKVEALFGNNERIHTSLAGAELNAACVIAGLKGQKATTGSPSFGEGQRHRSLRRASVKCGPHLTHAAQLCFAAGVKSLVVSSEVFRKHSLRLMPKAKKTCFFVD